MDGMEAHPFNSRIFYPVLCKWLKERGHPIPKLSEVPAIGWIALNDHHLVAMAFLRRMEGGHALMDGLVTNPEALPNHRHEGLKLAVNKVIQTAKELGIQQIIAFTTEESVVKRSITHGFVATPHQTLILSVHPDGS